MPVIFTQLQFRITLLYVPEVTFGGLRLISRLSYYLMGIEG